MKLGWFSVELHYGTILGWTHYVYYTTPYSSYTVNANLLDRPQLFKHWIAQSTG